MNTPLMFNASPATIEMFKLKNRSGFLNKLVENHADFFRKEAEKFANDTNQSSSDLINRHQKESIIKDISDKLRTAFNFETSENWRPVNEQQVAEIIGMNPCHSKELMIAVRRITGQSAANRSGMRIYRLPPMRKASTP